MNRIGIIGGGIVGLTTAWKLAKRFPGVEIILFEKEKGVGRHQSGNNSGVLHCGLYYKPGSLKARLAVNGIREMVEFCQEYEIPHEICGKLVLATNEIEVSRLDSLEVRGRENGLQGIRRMGPEEIAEREPNAVGLAALEVPQEGIVDYPMVCKTLVRLLEEGDHSIKLGNKILSGKVIRNGVRLHSDEGSFEVDYVVNCSGLHSDRVCRDLGNKPSVRIIPFRGDYFKLKPESEKLVNHLIYPVPNPKFPFLGVHFTRMIGGGIEAGPNAVLALSREGYGKCDISINDLAEIGNFPGFWRFFSKYKKMCLSELRQSLSRRLFCANLQRLVPSISESDLTTGGAGVRAQAMTNSGALVEDFEIVQSDRMLHVLNAPSPAATASLAIGDEIASKIQLN